MKLKHKLYIMTISFLVTVTMIIFGYFLPSYEKILIEQRETQLISSSDQATTMIEAMTKQGYSKDQIVEVIINLRYGKDKREYFFILTDQGYCIKHPTIPALDGTDVNQVKDGKGMMLVQEYLKISRTQGKGLMQYYWPWFNDKTRIEPKIAYVQTIPSLNMLVIATSYLDDIVAIITKFEIVGTMIVITMVFLGLLSSRFVINNVLKSIFLLKTKLQALTDDEDGNLSDIKIDRHDELGDLGLVFNIFLVKIREILTSTIAGTKELNNQAKVMMTICQQFNSVVVNGNTVIDVMTGRFGNLHQAISGLDEGITSNVASLGTVSLASQELCNIVTEISKQTSGTQHLTISIQQRMDSISASLQQLLANNEKTDDIVVAISNMANQINLLALNAKIEAARAGEYGAGFTVVANEINGLSASASKSVLKVNDIVNDNKKETAATIVGIRAVFESMTQIMTNIASIAAAIEEQSISSMEISKHILEVDKFMQRMQQESHGASQTADILEEQTEKISSYFIEITKLHNDLSSTVQFLNMVRVQINESLERFHIE